MRRRLALMTLLGSCAFAGSGLPGAPPGYLSRFSASPPQPFFAAGALGVRELPLPFPADVRLTWLRRAAYTEFGVETRLADTTVALGIFEGDPWGAPKFEVVRDPARGVRAVLAWRGAERLSEARLGYAWNEGGARWLADLGYGEQGEVRALFGHARGSAAREVRAGPLALNVAASADVFVFSTQAQGSLDLSLGASAWLAPRLSVSARHFARLVAGASPLPALRTQNDEVTWLSASFAPNASIGLLTLRDVTYSFERRWLSALTAQNLLSASASVNLGVISVNLTPRLDFNTGERGVVVGVLYRLGAFALGPSVDFAWLGGAPHASFGLIFAQ